MRTSTSTTSTLTTLLTVFALMACGSDGSTDPNGGNGGGGGGGDGGGGDGGGDGPAPAAVAVVSGDGQSAKTLETAGSPLVVRVTDADGEAVSGVTVSWSVTEGPGSVASSSATNAQGQAQTTFTAGPSLGTSTVTASVAGVAEAVEFTVETSTLVIRMLNTAFVVPGGGDAVTIPMGTTVEWVNRDDGLQHTATSTSVPGGASGFDSGLMNYLDRYSFTPTVAGTWTYFCEVHPGIMVGATITVTDTGGNSSSSDTDPPPSGGGDPYN